MRKYLVTFLFLILVSISRAAPVTLVNSTPFLASILAGKWAVWVTPRITYEGTTYSYCTLNWKNTLDPSSQVIQTLVWRRMDCVRAFLHYNECDNMVSVWAISANNWDEDDDPCDGGKVQGFGFLTLSEDSAVYSRGRGQFGRGGGWGGCPFTSKNHDGNYRTGYGPLLTYTYFTGYKRDDQSCFYVVGTFQNGDLGETQALFCTNNDDYLQFSQTPTKTSPSRTVPLTSICVPGQSYFLMAFSDQTLRLHQYSGNKGTEQKVLGYSGSSTSTMRIVQSRGSYLLISTITGVGFGTISTFNPNQMTASVSAYSASQNYFFTSDFSAISFGAYDSNVGIRFWTTKKNELLRDLDGKMRNFGDLNALLVDSSMVMNGFQFHSPSKQVISMATKNNNVITYDVTPVYACGNYTNCADCNINDPYYCGWNFNAVTCAQKVAGLVTNVRECPIITQIVPNVGAVGVSKTVVLSGSNLGLSTLSSYVPYCIITNSSTSIYVTGARLTDSSFSCPIPAQNQPNSVAVTLSLSTTGPNRPVYAKSANETANTFKFSFCSDYSTAPKCEAVLGELTDCGWCNSTSTCSPSTGCPASSFTRTLFPTVLEFSPNSLATGVESTFNIRGLNFVNLPSVNYTFHLFSASKRMEIPDDEPSNEEFSFEARVLSRNLIQSNVTVNSIGGFFAVLYSNKKLVDSSVNPIQTTNCTLLQSCGDCRRASVCNWCSDVCISRLLSSALLPCVQSNCQESLPSLSIVTGDVRENFDVDVNFWYSLDLNVNYTIDFGNNTEPIPLYFASGRTAIFSISSSQFTPGSYQPVIVGDNYVRNTSQTFVFTNCEGDNCKTSFTEDLGDTSDQTNPSSNTRPTDAIVQNSPSSQTNLVPVYIGASIGGFFLLLILVILIVILLRKKRDSFTDELIPPQDFEMVVVSKDAEQTFQVNKSHATILSGLETQLLRDGFPHAEEINDIVSTFDVNGFGKYYIYLAFSKDRFTARDLLQRYIRIEADATKVENEMFRNTSNGTQMFTAYAKVVGLEFLWNTLASPIHQIIKAGQQQGALDVQRVQSLGSNFDLDSDNQEDPEFVEANIYQLLSILSKIFARIRKNIFTLSPWIRLSIRDSRAYVSRRYPASDSKVVGSFLFLRYIVPAITSPQLYGITSEAPNEHAQRILILVSKVLQNLANETMPSAKMEGMQKMDQFVADNIPILHTMYDAVTNYHPSEEDLLNGGSALNLPDSCHENSIVWLHNFFSRNRSKLSAATLTDMGEFILPSEISKKNNKLE
eukprot:TRINITY_DN1411_c0_g1_i11.p1 TRINITY_DN1411_c0_g1~~TRINITY_DN1411_c0_g1_i11.p1  ORF type:complete len:1270 (-),score=370.86 TRINITY_DN1411_c0_g1_i11:141-3950(-)